MLTPKKVKVGQGVSIRRDNAWLLGEVVLVTDIGGEPRAFIEVKVHNDPNRVGFTVVWRTGSTLRVREPGHHATKALMG